MLRRVEVHTTIDHPVERVFPFLADPMRWHEFAPACIYRRQVGDEAPAVGSQWESTDLIGPFPIRFTDELLELEPSRRVVWWSSAPWNARVEYACDPDGDGGTRIRATYEGDISGFLRLLVGWLPPFVTHWILAQDFRRLRGILRKELESVAEAGATSGSWLAVEERGPEAS